MGDADVDSGAVVVGGDSEKEAKGGKGRGERKKDRREGKADRRENVGREENGRCDDRARRESFAPAVHKPKPGFVPKH